MPGLSEQQALELFARCVCEIAGDRSEAARDMVRAVQSGEIVDLMLAQSSFDALPLDMRREISETVRNLVASRLVADESTEATHGSERL